MKIRTWYSRYVQYRYCTVRIRSLDSLAFPPGGIDFPPYQNRPAAASGFDMGSALRASRGLPW